MNLTLTDLIIVAVFSIAAYGLINLLRLGLNRFLKWDVGEKERILHQRLTELGIECTKYKEEVSDLRKQIKTMVQQYDEAVIKIKTVNDSYNAALKQIDNLKAELERIKMDIRQSEARFNRVLIVAVGSPDAALNLDLASLRAVKMDTGMAFERILECTPAKLQTAIDQAKSSQAVIYLHLSIKSDSNGYQLMDEIVDADWLSENLQGVIILVVAGNESTDVGEFLGIIPYVVTMNETVPPKDAARFTRAFWTEIGKGIGPNLAFERAMQKAPGRMSEYVRKHWAV